MDEFKFTQDYVIYKVKKEGIYPIKESDWKRLKRQIGGIIPKKNIFQILSSIRFGIFASAIFSLIALNSTSNLDNWVLPTAWIIFWVSIISGIGFLILDKFQNDMITYSTNEVLTEMTLIEKAFETNGEEEG